MFQYIFFYVDVHQALEAAWPEWGGLPVCQDHPGAGNPRLRRGRCI